MSTPRRRTLDDEPRPGIPRTITDAHNEDCRPFQWTKTADEILDKVREFGERTLAVHEDHGP